MPLQEDVLRFVAEKSPERIIVYARDHHIIYQNPSARKFLDRHQLPEEIQSLTTRLFNAMDCQRTAELIPGHICFSKEIDQRRWVFRIAYREDQNPLVCIYFSDDTVSSRFDLNVVRQQHHLTRRETDVLRHLLDGLTNQAISEELGVIEQTVKDHLSSIYGKFGVQDRFSLLRYLVSSPQP